MIFVDLAVRNLKLHPLRSTLAVLGIVIGVAAIAAMGILGNSMVLSITDSITASGNTIIISPVGETSNSIGSASSSSSGGGAPPGGGGGMMMGSGGGGAPPSGGGGGESSSTTTPRFTEAQAQQIARIISTNGSVINVASTRDVVSVGKKNVTTQIYGLTPADAESLLGSDMESGTMLKSGGSGCIVGTTLATRYNLTVGSRITVASGGTLRVLGIIGTRGMSMDVSTDNAIVVPEEWFFQVYNTRSNLYDQVIVKANNIDDVETLSDELTTSMNHKERVISVQLTKTSLARIYDSFSTVTTFVSAIGGISLVVAGVSILNIMMMSVNERIREIGIMRSLGSQQPEVLMMFMYEALFLGIIGSAIGGALSLGAGYMVCTMFLKTGAYALAPSSLLQVVYGIGFGILISLICGIYPAWTASRMNPIDALRHE
ncbi:ABC transporter permease [Methanosphaerula subterraneus]|uniref:ABC transporter permease n=1 Tax=Methanosphaerula subterraneus TaxID=3350244 RepID=UPI003F872B02